MSATDELRRMLDERGVEWTYGDGTVSFSDGKHWCHAWAYNDDTMCVSMGYFTPEQAVAATLGAGTCKLTMNGTNGCFGCSECLENIPPLANFCPNCGRKVVDA